MAVARCETCGRPDRTKRFDYVFVAEPVGYPDPIIRCGKKGCKNPAKIWLYVFDAMAYQNRSQRIFSLPFHPAKKLTLKDGGYFVSDKREPVRPERTSRFKVWLSNSRQRAERGNINPVECDYFAADGVYVTVNGDGSDLENWIALRKDIFISCERVR
jgi:hypothetical protein